ncbi:thiamine pyrophosphate-dependent enzyme [Fretibacterium sp. OH1220_COT-178]|uniref:thiamine pyrophosphate-dependent enzyme n=1 Tax=Fretibacterium sp. OH1220_COT-178 TaxID=2491047 RepID=UPI000F5FF35B|nr:thiamine pyrophosphate-dependent enzyme [Fretibacterium sp. OH1220_COT-178]RRD64184.1 indolepyruvate ferredoxin oxidoreductase subunit alpha [Fretibacterium sp. OH1220_COT-178]
MNKKELLLGNEAIAEAIVAAGCQVATAYPGTPSSEILPAVARCADGQNAKIAVEWGANEKVAYEMAVTATFAGARACCVMKHVGLNVAADPFMTTALYELKGGMLLVAADDPGPHSSQNEQDSRFFAMFAKVPCLDPSDAVEAAAMVAEGYALSERHGVVTMLRPTTRIAHSRQAVELPSVRAEGLPVKFDRNPVRWCPLPALVRTSHPKHNERIRRIREEFETDWSRYNYELPASKPAKLGVIASGIAFASLCDVLKEWGRTDVDILKIGTPFPLPSAMADAFVARHERVLVLEESYPVIEMQLKDRTRVLGRCDGTVPGAGELLPEVIAKILLKALDEPAPKGDVAVDFSPVLEDLHLVPRKPQLCPGCPHRSSFFSIRRALPNAINPSDIGCYTLGINQKGIDASICMGGAVTMSSGFFLAHRVTDQTRPVVATIGDSTFYHMGVPGLLSAVYNRHAFVLCILDNASTAMTGGQSHPGLGDKPRRDDPGIAVDLERLVRGCGVSFVETVPAYDNAAGVDAVKRAWQHAEAERQPAVLIFKHPCMLLRQPQEVIPMTVDQEKCVGCRYCIDYFGCPGLRFDEKAKKTSIDPRYCVSCGTCEPVCPHKAIVKKGAN